MELAIHDLSVRGTTRPTNPSVRQLAPGLQNSVEVDPFAFLSGVFGTGSEIVKAALPCALVPALTGSGQCSIKHRRKANGALSLSETFDLLSVFVRSSPEFYNLLRQLRIPGDCERDSGAKVNRVPG